MIKNLTIYRLDTSLVFYGSTTTLA